MFAVAAVSAGAVTPLQGIDAQLAPADPLFSPMGTAVGWTGVVPDALLGGAAVQMLGESGWGLYVDAKMTHDRRSSHSDFLDGETAASVDAANPQHVRGGEEDEWLFFNLGVVRELSPQFAVFGAGGVGRHLATREYFDTSPPGERITPTGRYYVEDERASMGWGATGMGGFLLRVGESVVISSGFDWASSAITLGAFWIVR